MVVDEQRRSQLFQQLAASVGEEAATTMFDLLPPPRADVATTADIERLGLEMERRMDGLEARMDGLDARMDGLEHRMDAGFAAIHDELVGLRGELSSAVTGMQRELHSSVTGLQGELGNSLVGMQGELGSAVTGLHGELRRAVTGQTRALLIGVLTAVGSIAVLSWSFAQLL